MAKLLADDDLIGTLTSGDVCSNEIHYHKNEVSPCLPMFHRRYAEKVRDLSNCDDNSDDERHEITSFDKVKYYIIKKETEEPGFIFEVNNLEGMYINSLKNFGITSKSHVTRFAKKLKKDLPGLETRTLDNKRLTMYFKSTGDALIPQRIMTPTEISRSMVDVVSILRKEMGAMNNRFTGKLSPDNQLKSVPAKLVTLISMLIEGCSIVNDTFSQEVISVSQIIQSNFHEKQRKSGLLTHRIQKKNETPVLMYIGLKLYATVRSKNLVNTLFSMGICVSYTRVSEIVRELSCASISQYNINGVFAQVF